MAAARRLQLIISLAHHSTISCSSSAEKDLLITSTTMEEVWERIKSTCAQRETAPISPEAPRMQFVDDHVIGFNVIAPRPRATTEVQASTYHGDILRLSVMVQEGQEPEEEAVLLPIIDYTTNDIASPTFKLRMRSDTQRNPFREKRSLPHSSYIPPKSLASLSSSYGYQDDNVENLPQASVPRTPTDRTYRYYYSTSPPPCIPGDKEKKSRNDENILPWYAFLPSLT